MIRNQNGYWMSPKWFALFAPDDGAGNGAGGEGGSEGAGGGAEDDASGAEEENNDNDEPRESEELAKLKSELSKVKAAMDKAAKEASDAKKALRAKQTAEEIAAEEKKEADEKAAREIDELRREVARTKAVKSVMSKLGTDEETSGKVAEYLYGAEDVDAALAEIQRAWTAREKALRIEFGKIPPPGAGGASGEDPEIAKAISLAKQLGQNRAENSKSVRDGLSGYIR